MRNSINRRKMPSEMAAPSADLQSLPVSSPTPTGLRLPAQGCEALRATLGSEEQSSSTPKVLCPCLMGCDVSSIITQGCSKTREPWAVGRNTFGVQAALFALVITFITQAAHAENYENVRAALKDADTKTRASDFTGAHVALDAAIAMKGITSTELYSAHYKKA